MSQVEKTRYSPTQPIGAGSILPIAVVAYVPVERFPYVDLLWAAIGEGFGSFSLTVGRVRKQLDGPTFDLLVVPATGDADSSDERNLMTLLQTDPIEYLDCEIRRSGEHALVMLDGELDLSTAPLLRELLAELAGEGVRHVALNLAELEFVDSCGLSLLITEHKRVEALGGELIIFSPCHQVRRLFEITALHNYLNVRPQRPHD